MEGARQAKTHYLGEDAQRGHLSLRADHHHGIANGCADSLRQVLAQHDGGQLPIRRRRRLRFQRAHRARRGCRQKVAHRLFVAGQNAFDQRASIAGSARHQHLLIESRRSRGDVRQAAQPVEQRLPVADAVSLHAHQLHMRARSQQTVLNVAPHAVGNGQRDDQRGHPRGYPGDGDGGHHSDHGLPPLGLQVTRRHKEFESHCTYFAGAVNTVLATPTLSCRS